MTSPIITKPCPLCGGEGRWTSDSLVRCKDAQCDFITSHYYWHSIAVLLRHDCAKFDNQGPRLTMGGIPLDAFKALRNGE